LIIDHGVLHREDTGDMIGPHIVVVVIMIIIITIIITIIIITIIITTIIIIIVIVIIIIITTIIIIIITATGALSSPHLPSRSCPNPKSKPFPCESNPPPLTQSPFTRHFLY
jgi:hypothetical protein